MTRRRSARRSNHASLNIANAFGAWLGGVVISAGYGYRATGLVGAALALAGFMVLLIAAGMARETTSVVRTD